MNNFIVQMKSRIATFQKAKDDALKELNDFKNANPPQKNASEQKTDLYALRSRFLQSQLENERLKKRAS